MGSSILMITSELKTVVWKGGALGRLGCLRTGPANPGVREASWWPGRQLADGRFGPVGRPPRRLCEAAAAPWWRKACSPTRFSWKSSLHGWPVQLWGLKTTTTHLHSRTHTLIYTLAHTLAPSH